MVWTPATAPAVAWTVKPDGTTNTWNAAGIYAYWDDSTESGCNVNTAKLSVTNTISGNGTSGGVRCIAPQTAGMIDALNTGKYYFEITYAAIDAFNGGIAVGSSTASYSDICYDSRGGGAIGAVMLMGNGNIFANGDYTGYRIQGGPNEGDTIGVCVDVINLKVWFKIVAGPSFLGSDGWNGVDTTNDDTPVNGDPVNNTGGVSIPSADVVPMAIFGWNLSSGDVVMTANFGATPYSVGTDAFASAIGYVNWPPP